MKKTVALFLSGLIVVIPVLSGRANVLKNPGKDPVVDSLLKMVPGWMESRHVPVVGVGIIRDGQIAWLHTFGELRPGKPAPANSLFNIASQTKPVTAMLVMKLVAQGKWNLDEPLVHFWIDPDLSPADSNLVKLTTRLVLSHQSGFPNWRTDNGGRKLQFLFAPGTRFGYSGEGFEYLRRALEKKFSLSLDKLMDSILFKPAGMTDTHYWSDALDSSRFAHWSDGQGRPYQLSMATSVSAADDLISNIADYCRFGIYVMQGLGLPDSLIQEIARPQVKVKENYYRGLGWGVVKGLPEEEYALEHGGSDIGVRTMAVFLPDSKSGVVIMTNGDNGLFVIDQIIKTVLPTGGALLGIMNKGNQVHEKITLSPNDMEKFSGTYAQANGQYLYVRREGNGLKVYGDGVPTSLVYPESSTRFFLEGYDVQIEFFPPATGTGMTLAVFESGKQVMRINRISRETQK